MNEARELTRNERKAIKKLVVSECANYDHDYGCLPLDNPCYMLNKWWTGSYCKYFRNAILPLDPALQASLTQYGPPAARKACPVCKTPYLPVTSQAYCSDACRLKRQREADKRRKRDKRRKKGAVSGT